MFEGAHAVITVFMVMAITGAGAVLYHGFKIMTGEVKA